MNKSIQCLEELSRMTIISLSNKVAQLNWNEVDVHKNVLFVRKPNQTTIKLKKRDKCQEKLLYSTKCSFDSIQTAAFSLNLAHSSLIIWSNWNYYWLMCTRLLNRWVGVSPGVKILPLTQLSTPLHFPSHILA